MSRIATLIVALSLFAVPSSRAQQPPRDVRMSEGLPEPLKAVGIEQRLDERIPLELSFRDESGSAVRLEDYFDDKPVVLALAYYTCPMLCSQVLHGMASSLASIGLDAGEEFEVVTVSFDPRDTPESASAMKRSVLQRYDRHDSDPGWHFLTGDEESIQRLTEAVGFGYAWDSDSKQYAHASGIMILTPEGRLSRYYYGLEYPPRDVRLGLIEAARSDIGTPVDQLLLYCYQYNPATGKYGAVVMNILRLASLVTVAFLIGLIVFLSRYRPSRSRTDAPDARV